MAGIAGATRKLATRLRQMGIGPGDRVVAYMPNLPETVIAMLVTTAIGATWSSAAPEFGSAEIYRTMEAIPQIADSLVLGIEDGRGDFWMPLFVQLAPGETLTEDLKTTVHSRLRTERSPRHVPDEITAAPEIPVTLTGKKMKVPVRKLMMGLPRGRLPAVTPPATRPRWTGSWPLPQTAHELFPHLFGRWQRRLRHRRGTGSRSVDGRGPGGERCKGRALRPGRGGAGRNRCPP